jgi:hypothetical protein
VGPESQFGAEIPAGWGVGVGVSTSGVGVDDSESMFVEYGLQAAGAPPAALQGEKEDGASGPGPVSLASPFLLAVADSAQPHERNRLID